MNKLTEDISDRPPLSVIIISSGNSESPKSEWREVFVGDSGRHNYIYISIRMVVGGDYW